MDKAKYENAPAVILGLKLSEEVGEVNKELIHAYHKDNLRGNVFEELDQVIFLAETLKRRLGEAA